MYGQSLKSAWQIDAEAAEAYERFLVPHLFRPGAEGLIGLIGLQTGERVLDVACGTGIVARLAAEKSGAQGRVVGLDRNRNMLEAAEKASAGISPPIEWHHGSAEALPFGENEFDVVVCQQGLQFFHEPDAALREAFRVLGPNGRVALSVLRPLDHSPGYEILAKVLGRHFGPEVAEMMRSPFSSFSVEGVRDLLVAAGFRDPRVLIGVAPIRYPSSEAFLFRELASSPRADAIDELDRDRRVSVVHDLEESLHHHLDDDGVVFPAETFIVTATR